MEYFSFETLTKVFCQLAKPHPAAVALVEPVDPDHDLLNDPASYAFGQENSFSHNHESLSEIILDVPIAQSGRVCQPDHMM